jgi:hypothetical protein
LSTISLRAKADVNLRLPGDPKSEHEGRQGHPDADGDDQVHEDRDGENRQHDHQVLPWRTTQHLEHAVVEDIHPDLHQPEITG